MRKQNAGINTKDVNPVTPGNLETYNMYRRDITKCGEPLTREAEKELFDQYRETPTKELFDKICGHNLWFVVSVAKKYARFVQNNAITFEDLISEGNIGLIKAIHKYDNSKGFRFISYAVWNIMAEITTSLNNNSKTIRMPSNESQLLRKIIKEHDYLVQKTADVVDSQLLLDRLKEQGIVSETYQVIDLEFIMNFKDATNMSSFGAENEDFNFEDVIVDESQSSDSLALNDEHIRLLTDALNKLPSRVCNIFKSYYGLDGMEPKMAKDIARELEVTSESIFLTMRKYLRQIRKDIDLKDHYFDTKTSKEERKIIEKKNEPIVSNLKSGRPRKRPIAHGGPVYTMY